ncbi:MAG: phosphohistidine phosphatase SixA [Acidobacteria bacterium]|nr:MAG: phosphohistidine phosphatase SixA [Acidobacteriota bacterium]
MSDMRLYLVRHGNASSAAVDPACGLSAQGRAEIARLAAFLEPLKLQPAEVRHSGKDRAEQTARILTAALGNSPSVTQVDGLNPNDSPWDIAAELEEEERDLLLVGHLPFMSLLSSHLLARGGPPEVVRFRTGTMICLQRSHGNLWHLEWIVHPGLLPDVGVVA